MRIHQSMEGGVLTLKLQGRFDFKARRIFRDNYETTLNEAGVRALDIDLGEVDYMDSSALGMLLLVKERATAIDIPLRLTQCVNSVRQILDIANFGKIFTIV